MNNTAALIVGPIFIFFSLCAILIYSGNVRDTTWADHTQAEINCVRNTEDVLGCCLAHSGMNEWYCRKSVKSAEKMTYKEYLIKKHEDVIGCTLIPGEHVEHKWD